MHVFGYVHPQHARQICLWWRSEQQVVSAHHLCPVLPRVVQHDSEVVGGGAVVSTDHQVIQMAHHRAVQQVLDSPLFGISAQPQRAGAFEAQSSAIRLAQLAARPRIGARTLVWRARSLKDLPAGAKTLVGSSFSDQTLNRPLIQVQPLGLAHYRTLRFDPERRQIGQLGDLELRLAALLVEVFNPNQKLAAR